MNTKKFYIAPTMEAVEIEAVTLLTGSSTSFGPGGVNIDGMDDGSGVGDEWS